MCSAINYNLICDLNATFLYNSEITMYSKTDSQLHLGIKQHKHKALAQYWKNTVHLIQNNSRLNNSDSHT